MTGDKPPYIRRSAPSAQLKRSAPSAQRNRSPILEFLSPVLTRTGTVLEVGSGTGEHAAWFAPRLSHITWQPTEANDDMHDSISAWAADADMSNLRPPLTLDVLDDIWAPAEEIDDLIAVVAICMAHISPWAVTEALFRGAAKYLPSGAVLYLYGPFLGNGVPTAPSNVQFDAQLRRENPAWGVRNLEDVTKLGEAVGLSRETVTQMPANNLSLVFRQQ